MLLEPRSLERGYFQREAIEQLFDEHRAEAIATTTTASGGCSIWNCGIAFVSKAKRTTGLAKPR